MKKKLSILLISMMLCVNIANAGNVSINFSPNSILSASCLITANNVAFGPIGVAKTGTATATGSIYAICTRGSAYTLKLNAGVSGIATARTMIGASSHDSLSYNLYTDAAHTQIFSSGEAGTVYVSATGTGLITQQNIYAQMPLNQYVTPDNYSDTLTATISY